MTQKGQESHQDPSKQKAKANQNVGQPVSSLVQLNQTKKVHPCYSRQGTRKRCKEFQSHTDTNTDLYYLTFYRKHKFIQKGGAYRVIIKRSMKQKKQNLKKH